MEDRGTVLGTYGLSERAADHLDLFVAELRRWQTIKNLVGPATLDEVWTRHVADSLQLLDLARDATTWLDLGSGAGFPGLVVAIAGAERGIRVDLVESNARKCAFLRQVARLTGAPAEVHLARVEAVVSRFVGRADVVSARALAPLPQLLAWCEPLLTTGTVGLFPKGRDSAAELTSARKLWRFSADEIASRTDSSGRILRITALSDLSPSGLSP